MPEPQPVTQRTEHFAMYMQIRTGVAAGTVSKLFDTRFSWVVLPSPELTDNAHKTFYFYRKQIGDTNRSRWNLQVSEYTNIEEQAKQTLRDYSDDNARMDQPIVVGLSNEELVDIMQNPTRAPWPVLNRVSKVSTSHGGFFV